MRNFFFRLLYFMHWGHIIMYFNKLNYRIPILTYHRISPHSDNFWNPITPQQFELHINFLSKKYKLILLDDLFIKTKEQLHNCCIVVFDDAFKDFHRYALPIIKKYNVPVTMFVPVDCVTKNEIIWTSQIDNCFKYTDKKELRLSIVDKIYFFNLTTEEQKIKAAFKVQKLLIELPDELCKKYINEIKMKLGCQNDPQVGMMSWKDIRETTSFINYQSHSLTHCVLSKIEDKTILEYEIYGSKKALSENIGSQIKFIAYPIGKYNRKVSEIARMHYEAGFCTNNKLIDLKKLNDLFYKYSIPRFNIHDSSSYELFFRINGFHNFFDKFFSK